MTSKSIKRVRGDLEPDLPLQLVLKDPSRCPEVRARDLTELTVRAMLYNAFLVESDPCDGLSYVEATNALWHRVLPKREVDVLAATAVAAPAEDELHGPDADPAAAQRISIEITGFVSGGTITLTGTDVDGEIITEVITITGDGTVFSTLAYATLDDVDEEADPNTAGIVVSAGSEFSFRLYVHDGLVDLVWQAGDTDLAGDYLLIVELVDTSGEIETACAPIKLTIAPKIKRPVPIVTSLSPSPVVVASRISITGLHYLDATGAKLIEVDTGNETELAVDEAVNPLTVSSFDTEVVPVIPGGNYWLVVLGAEDESEKFSFILLPIVQDFDPITTNPGDTITIDGDGFTGATAAHLIDSDGTPTLMDNFTFVNDDQVTADVPVGLTAGEYLVRVTGASNLSNSLGTLTVETP